jgi:outer membrane protein OmpA-like peptidoglycan-associated protein
VKPATVMGFGSQLAVASNDTPDGRQKNRRVEIWLRK